MYDYVIGHQVKMKLTPLLNGNAFWDQAVHRAISAMDTGVFTFDQVRGILRGLELAGADSQALAACAATLGVETPVFAYYNVIEGALIGPE